MLSHLKRSVNVKWSIAWKNFKLLKGLTPDKKCFYWKVSQDMLPVGNRIHRNNAERRCLAVLTDGSSCQVIQDREHAFKLCPMVVEIYDVIIEVLNSFLERDVKYQQLIHFSFNHRDKKRLKCSIWFAVKMMFSIFHNKCLNKILLLSETIKELTWNIDLNRKIGSLKDMIELKDLLLVKVDK